MIAAQTANPPLFLPRLRLFGRALVLILALWTMSGPVAQAASAPAPANFLSNLDDIPLMPGLSERKDLAVGSSRVDLQACKLEYSIVSPK